MQREHQVTQKTQETLQEIQGIEETCGDKTEQKKVFIDIMAKYNEGKAIAAPEAIIIKKLTHLDEKDKLPNIIFRKSTDIKPKDQKAYDEAVSKYNKGMQMTLDAKEELLNGLSNFIHYMIKTRFPTFKNHTTDLYQEGVIGILKGIDKYDATRTLPTTYFYIYVFHEMSEYINMDINKTTSHYSTNITKVKKAISSFEHEGRDYTPTDIAQETGISSETILQTMRIMQCANEMHYESPDYLDSQLSQNMDSPENEYLKMEANETLYKAVASLPEDEARIIVLKYHEGMSYKNISIALDIPIDQVKRKHNASIRKLRKSKTIQGGFNLIKEDRALNSNDLGVVPVEIGESIMEQLLQAEGL